MLDERTRKYICGLEDELVVMYVVAGSATYEPEAIAFALEELNRRALDSDALKRLKADAKTISDAQIVAARQARIRPLDRDGRILAFVFGGLILSPLWFFLWLQIQNRGEIQKARDMWRFGLLGLGSLLVVLGIMQLGAYQGEPYINVGRWMIGIGVTVISLMLVRQSLRKKTATAADGHPRCVSCGYDLHATPERCPECGKSVGSASADDEERT